MLQLLNACIRDVNLLHIKIDYLRKSLQSFHQAPRMPSLCVFVGVCACVRAYQCGMVSER